MHTPRSCICISKRIHPSMSAYLLYIAYLLTLRLPMLYLTFSCHCGVLFSFFFVSFSFWTGLDGAGLDWAQYDILFPRGDISVENSESVNRLIEGGGLDWIILHYAYDGREGMNEGSACIGGEQSREWDGLS